MFLRKRIPSKLELNFCDHQLASTEELSLLGVTMNSELSNSTPETKSSSPSGKWELWGELQLNWRVKPQSIMHRSAACTSLAVVTLTCLIMEKSPKKYWSGWGHYPFSLLLRSCKRCTPTTGPPNYAPSTIGTAPLACLRPNYTTHSTFQSQQHLFE